MTEQNTVEAKRPDEKDLAPLTAGQTLAKVGNEADVLLQGETQNLSVTEPLKRKKTRGERLFDFTVYAGIMWGVNELITTIIGRGIMKGEGVLEWGTKQATGRPELLKSKYDALMSKIPGGFVGTVGKQAINIFILTIGGNILVPVAKFLEDRKGKIVRWTDSWLESKDTKHTERLEQAHTEMDNAPKQSWGSLWEGRGTVLGAAILIDFFIGGNDAPSTKLLKNTPLNDWSSMTRASTSVTRLFTSILKPSMRETIKNARAISPHTIVESVESALKNPALKDIPKDVLKKAEEGKGMGFAADNSFVLVLSAATAFCFYLTSKFFARKRDEKEVYNEHKREVLQDKKTHQPTASLERTNDNEHAANDETPLAKVDKPELLSRVAKAPEAALQAGGAA